MFRVRGKTLSCVPTSLQFMTKEAVGGFPEMMIPYLVVGCLRASAETFPPSTKLKLCKKFTSLDCNAWIFSPLSIQFPCKEKLKVLKWDETWSSFFKTLHCRKKYFLQWPKLEAILRKALWHNGIFFWHRKIDLTEVTNHIKNIFWWKRGICLHLFSIFCCVNQPQPSSFGSF